jgi:hypothetical protein
MLNVAATNIESKYWLIAAYTTLVGGAPLEDPNKSDYMKIAKLTGTSDENDQPPSTGDQGVPQPASLLYDGLGAAPHATEPATDPELLSLGSAARCTCRN